MPFRLCFFLDTQFYLRNHSLRHSLIDTHEMEFWGNIQLQLANHGLAQRGVFGWAFHFEPTELRLFQMNQLLFSELQK